MRLTDILLEPVSNLMGSKKAEGSKPDPAARVLEARALLLSTRRLPATCFNATQVHMTLNGMTLNGALSAFGSVAGGHGPYRRGCRPTEAFSELALPA